MQSNPEIPPTAATLTHATFKETVAAARYNSRLMIWLIVAGAAYVVVSARFFRTSEALQWSTGKALYFTSMNTFAGAVQFQDPHTWPGGLLVLLNALVGLTLFGCFIALLTMSFQSSEPAVSNISIRIATHLAAMAPRAGGHPPDPTVHGVPRSSTAGQLPTGADLAERLDDELTRARQLVADAESAGTTNAGAAETASKLARSLADLTNARKAAANAEAALRETEVQSWVDLDLAAFHTGTKEEIKMRRVEIKRHPQDPPIRKT
jgi:hypothetical protein